MSALSRQKIQISSGEKSSLILYDKERLKDAIQLAMEFRGKDKNTQIQYDRRSQPEALPVIQEA